MVLGDQPGVAAALIDEMAQAFAASGRGIVVPAHEGRRGHPLLFSMRFRDEVLTEYDDTGLRGLLRAHPEAVWEVEQADREALADMDYPADYQCALARLARKSQPDE